MLRRSERFHPICHDRSRRVDQENRYPKEGFTIDDLFLLGSLGLKTDI